MKTVILTGILLVLLLPAWAFADGNRLLRQCGSLVAFLDGAPADTSGEVLDLLEKHGEVSLCLGFIQGITQTNLLYQRVLDENAQFCLPAGGITNGQAARIVVKYLRDHPEDLHRHEFVLAFRAFKEAFPCKNARQRER